MKLDYIKLKNYRQYRDAKVDLSSTDSKRNFVIIIGTTGAGKTNLLNAITWCLYGLEYNIRDKYKALPLINLTTFGRMNEGDTSTVSVEIQMRGDKDEKLIFRRELPFRKSNGNPASLPNYNSPAPDKSTFTLIRQVGRDMMPTDSPEFILNGLIPQSIEEYFFFDGERLNEYFIDTSGDAIKEAVFRISQLGLLDRLIYHLSKRKDDHFRRLGKTNPEADRIQQSLDVWKRSLETTLDELSGLKKSRDEAKKQIKKFRDKLQTSSSTNIKELEQERGERLENVRRLEKRIAELDKKKLQFLVEFVPFIFMQEQLDYLHKLIVERDQSGKIPPEFQKGFIERLLKEWKCICGTDLKKHKECKQALEKSLTEYDVLDQLGVLLIRLDGLLNRIEENVKEFDERRIEYGQTLRDLDLEREQNSKRINQISEMIKGTNKKQIIFWETKFQEWDNAKINANKQIAVKEYQIGDYEKRISRLESLLESEMKKEKKHNELVITHAFCKRALSIAEQIKDEIMTELKAEIEKKTKEQFLSLSWKSSDYKDIKIDDEYNVSVIHQSGLEHIGTLSAGEGTLLALSFMAALNSVSGFNVPIVIDTPLGRIAGLPRKAIAKKLPSYLPNRQVTMLMTDTEYTDDVKDLLSNRVGITYQIDFIQTQNGGIAKFVPIK